MATYYWVGGAGTWNNSSTTHWSTISGGGSGAGPPGNGDTVVFDNLSDSGTGFTVTCTASSATCANITFGSGGTALDQTATFSGTLQVYGSATFPTTNIVATSLTLQFNSTSTGQTFTSGGNTFSAITVQGTGGAWAQQDNLTLSGIFTLTAGAWTIGTRSMSCASFTTGTGSTTRSLIFSTGGSATCTGAAGWTWAGSGASLTQSTSTITLSSASSASDITFAGGDQTYYDVTFTGGQNTGLTGVAMTGANSFHNLSFTAPSTTGMRYVTFSADQTITGTLTCAGASAIRRMRLKSDTTGSKRNLTVATLATCSDCDFQDIGADGVSAPWSGTRLGNMGNLSSITTDTAKQVYWNLSGTQNWSATGWATTSTGSPAVNNFPLPQDTATFTDDGSAGTITLNNCWAVGSIVASARTSAMTLTFGSSVNISLCGNWTMGSGVTLSGGSLATLIFTGRTTQTITPAAKAIPAQIDIDNPSGTVALAADTTFSYTSGYNKLQRGTLDLAGYVLDVAFLDLSFSRTRAIAFGSGRIDFSNASATYYMLRMSTVTGYTSTGTPTLRLTNSGSTVRYLNIGAIPESYAMNVTVTAGSGNVAILTAATLNSLTTESGFSGTIDAYWTLYGSLTIGANTSVNATANSLTFAATSGTKTITSNGKTVDCPIVINAPGATIQLGDALTMGSTRVLTLTAGTFDANNKNISLGGFATDGSTTRTLTMGSGTWTCNTTAPWTITSSSSLTLNANASTIALPVANSSTRTFAGGGLTYCNLTTSGAGSGQITITGTNTFTGTISSTRSVAYTWVFPNVTTTVAGFTVAGTAGNVVTLARTGVSGTWSIQKSTPGNVKVDYLSISNSNASFS